MGALRPKLPRVLVECAWRKCVKHARRVCVYPAPDRRTDGRLRGGCCVLCLSRSSRRFWLSAPLALLLLLECLMVAAGNESVGDKLELIIIIIIIKKRHTKATPAVRREASPSGSRCCICVRRTRRRFLVFLCLWHWKECEEGETDGWRGGEEGVLGFSFPTSPPLPLFGEFADDADQRSVFVLQTLVVCPQVDQDLEVELGRKRKKNMNTN